MYARKPPLEKGYTGPWEIVQARWGGSSYKLKHLRQRRWISRRAEHLKTAFIRPAHLKSKRTQQKINLVPDTTHTTALDAQEYSPSDTESGDELPPRDLPLLPPNSSDVLGDEIVNTSNTGVLSEDNNIHSPGSSALSQAESGTDSTTSNENALPINEQINEGLGNETVNTSNGVVSEDNSMHLPGTSTLDQADSGTNGATSNENAPPINQQVSESYTTQSTTELLRSTRSRRPPDRFGDWLCGDDTEVEEDIS